MPRHYRPGRESRPREYFYRQGGALPMARQAQPCARSRDESRRPSARRRRGQVERKPSAVAVGDAGEGIQDAQEEAVGQLNREPPPTREPLIILHRTINYMPTSPKKAP